MEPGLGGPTTPGSRYASGWAFGHLTRWHAWLLPALVLGLVARGPRSGQLPREDTCRGRKGRRCSQMVPHPLPPPDPSRGARAAGQSDSGAAALRAWRRGPPRACAAAHGLSQPRLGQEAQASRPGLMVVSLQPQGTQGLGSAQRISQAGVARGGALGPLLSQRLRLYPGTWVHLSGCA